MSRLTIHIRPAATDADYAAAYALVHELAVYEKAAHEHQVSLEQFTEDGKCQNYQLHVAEIGTQNDEKQIVGIVLFYLAYSTWKGKIVYLDDLVVTEKYRQFGIGKQLTKVVFAYAAEQQVQQVRWHVLNWNKPALEFYRKIGAKIEDDWLTCKFDAHAIQALAKEL